MKIDKYLEWDQRLMLLINKRLRHKRIDDLMVLITYLGSLQVSVAFCILAFLFYGTSFSSLGAKLALSLVASGVITQLIKRLVSRLRPFQTMKELHIKKIGIDAYSFPSGHTCAAFSMGVTIFMFSHRLGIISLPQSLLVGISRIYLGVHFPSDVLVGAFIGSISSVLIYYI